jgi:hypothetical protein
VHSKQVRFTHLAGVPSNPSAASRNSYSLPRRRPHTGHLHGRVLKQGTTLQTVGVFCLLLFNSKSQWSRWSPCFNWKLDTSSASTPAIRYHAQATIQTGPTGEFRCPSSQTQHPAATSCLRKRSPSATATSFALFLLSGRWRGAPRPHALYALRSCSSAATSAAVFFLIPVANSVACVASLSGPRVCKRRSSLGATYFFRGGGK